MKFLADQCVFGKTIRTLRENGFEVVTLRDLDKASASNAEVLAIASEQDLILISNDLDFANILIHPPGTHQGLIVLRVNQQTEDLVHQNLVEYLATVNRESLRRALTVIDHRGWRIRR